MENTSVASMEEEKKPNTFKTCLNLHWSENNRLFFKNILVISVSADTESESTACSRSIFIIQLLNRKPPHGTFKEL